MATTVDKASAVYLRQVAGEVADWMTETVGGIPAESQDATAALVERACRLLHQAAWLLEASELRNR